jgi:uncharacterized protein (TIGR00730 family)
MDKKVCIFCAASVKIDEKYNDAARELVRALHALNYTIVSGGGKVGTMGAITAESVRVGGHHVAVIPGYLKGLANPDIKEVIWTETMSERKEKMREGTCAAIALPGGIGTIDEFVETHTLRKLHKYEGELFALNLDGYYDPYIDLLDHFVEAGTLEAADRDLVHFPRTVAELVACFE